MTAPSQPELLIIGGLDSSGGAGLMRDALAAAPLAVTCRYVATAITAQNDAGVLAVQTVEPSLVASQISAASPDNLRAVKIGMLGSAAIVSTVARSMPPCTIVLDPVFRSSSGGELLDRAGITAMIDQLFPKVTVLTPNLPELRALGVMLGLGESAEPFPIAERLFAQGCGAVVVKGGHATDQHGDDKGIVTDTLLLPGATPIHYSAPRFPFSQRGTGCHYATVLAAALALGHSLPAAAELASKALQTRFRLASQSGLGQRPVPSDGV